MELQEGEILIELGTGEFTPVDEVEVLAGFAEGEDLKAEGGQDQIRVAGAVEREPNEGGGGKEGEWNPPPAEIGVARESVGDKKHGKGSEDGGENPENLSLARPGEAEFLMRFSDLTGSGHIEEKGEAIFARVRREKKAPPFPDGARKRGGGGGGLRSHLDDVPFPHLGVDVVNDRWRGTDAAV